MNRRPKWSDGRLPGNLLSLQVLVAVLLAFVVLSSVGTTSRRSLLANVLQLTSPSPPFHADGLR